MKRIAKGQLSVTLIHHVLFLGVQSQHKLWSAGDRYYTQAFIFLSKDFRSYKSVTVYFQCSTFCSSYFFQVMSIRLLVTIHHMIFLLKSWQIMGFFYPNSIDNAKRCYHSTIQFRGNLNDNFCF